MSLKRKSGLGKGLDALFLDNNVEETKLFIENKIETKDINLDGSGPTVINISQIEPNKNQPRKIFDDSELTNLADSIRQYGLIQPIIVRKFHNDQYQIIAGERRWRASRMAGISEIPCIIKDMDDVQVLEIALIENLQREDLNIIEEALCYKELIEKFNMTQDKLSQKIGKSRPVISNAIRLLNLPESIINLIKNRELSSGHARALLSLDDEYTIEIIANKIIDKSLTVRDTEKLIKNHQKVISSNSEEKKIKYLKEEDAAVINDFKKDVFYDELELALKEQLGRNIKINVHNDKGSIEIEFYNKDEIFEIVNKLSSD